MRAICTYLLALLYLLVVGQSVLPYIEYYTQKDFIAAELCENKDKPWMQCDGKCYLTKQIKKVTQYAEPDAPLPISSNVEVEEVEVHYSDSFEWDIVSENASVTHTFFYSAHVLTSIFIPVVPPPEALFFS